ncbi:outer membrane lipoprotein-sorting protein [Vibrio sp. CAIM 722]|uniref:Outer membrane lipoprotein-sorting protein n=1 Tax=Vibrio eleionomae TaxID=2653505 RepID=A0A7X4RWS9_9VIBR|nr:outer membrane lipoprotein-sorting protein [Vibrio eleionomae]MZI95529.1 outer membrane lipoprotein-sorting protein [Vibrio eleionomae]
MKQFISSGIWVKPKSLVAAIVCTIALIQFGFSTAYAADQDKGLTIAKERKARDKGWQDTTADVQMILKNAQGDQSSRVMRMKTLEVANDGDKGLTIFDEPLDVKGTVFLSYSHIQGDDDQWLYLPALKRVKRISSRNKSGPFMGSEFSYEDLSSFEVEKYHFRYLRDESVDGQPCFVVEQVPIDKMSGYTKIIVWIDKAEYRPIKTEYYDRKKALLKTLTLTDYKQYLNHYWRALTLEMVNHQTGKSTVLKTSNIDFKTGLSERDFNKNIMTRMR